MKSRSISVTLACAPLSLVGAVVGMLAFAPGTSDAVPLTAQSHFVLVVNPGDGRIEFRDPGEGQHILPGAHETPGGSGANWHGLASGETDLDPPPPGPGLESRPFASARADSFSQLAVTPQGTLVNAPGEAAIQSQLSYQVVIASIVPPPVPLQYVPITVNARASVFSTIVGDTATNDAHSSASVTIAGFGVLALSAANGQEVTEEQDVDFQSLPGALIDVVLRVSAVARSGGNQGGPLNTSAVATGFADPVFSFDQEAFDEIARQQGFAPFDLNLYFRFEQSQPPGSSVPVQWAPSPRHAPGGSAVAGVARPCPPLSSAPVITSSSVIPSLRI